MLISTSSISANAATPMTKVSDWESGMKDEEITISLVARRTGRKIQFFYEYGFGDDWQYRPRQKRLDPGRRSSAFIKKGESMPPRRTWKASATYKFLEAIATTYRPLHR